MNPQRVCAFYSLGPHYLRMLAHLRAQYPGARIIAIVPEGYLLEVLENRCDEVATTPPGRGAASLLPLARFLRAGRFDVFVVMFHSPRLRMLAALSGARECMCYTAGNRYFPVSLNFAGDAARWLARQIAGRITYARIWWNVRMQKVQR